MSEFGDWLACAAFLLNYSGDLPQVEVLDRAPTHNQCEAAFHAATPGDMEFLRAAYGSKLTCFAVTYSLGDHALIFMRHDAPARVQMIEAIRAINGKRRNRRMPWAEVYQLADRRAECGE